MGLLWSRSWRVLKHVLPMNHVRMTVWTHLASMWNYRRSPRLANWNFPVPNFSAVGMAVRIWCCGTPSCLLCQLLVLGKLKPLVTLSPLCCKTSLNLVVLKLAPQAYLESCRKTGDVSRYLSYSPDFFSVFRIWNANKVFHTSCEFMAAECSGVIDNE